MQRLQGLLEKYAESNENYVTEFWRDDMYLKISLPLPINSSPFFLLPKQEFKSDDERFRYIARFIIFSLTFKQRVDSGELKQEFSGGQGKGNALSMATYHHFFTAYRRPGAIKDQLIFSEGSSRHIIVICNNQLFVLMIPGRIALPSEKALVEKLQKIQVLSKQEPHYPPVGILTALNRKEWARIRERMIENDNNRESIQIIENCLFVVCMDESDKKLRRPRRWISYSDEWLEEMAHHILHGNKSEHSTGNRWFDKFIQFIVTKNGVNGIVMEHSVSEGITVLRFCEEFLDFVKKEQPMKSSDDLLRVKKLIWDLNKPVEKEIKNASVVTDALIDTLELDVFIFDEYGKGLPKEQKISPDVFIQLCLQLTYFRMHGKVTATYESAALRKFRFGRSDNIRASSQEALDFSKSMLDPSLSQVEKWDKFQKAVKKQTEILLYTINGEGQDNHLLCLKEMAALHGLQEPALYKTDYYKEFLNFRLATSQLPTKYPITVGYGPVVPDGYGCSYNPQERRIVFCISSFKNNSSTDSKQFAQNLKLSLMELKGLCESVKAAVSTSSPTKAAVKAEAKEFGQHWPELQLVSDVGLRNKGRADSLREFAAIPPAEQSRRRPDGRAVRHNGALLGTEFSPATVTLPNARLIPSLSPPLDGRLLRHVAGLYWMVEVQHILKGMFLLFCPIPLLLEKMTEIKETELPKPSVPELSVTINRFLEGIRAIVPGDKYEEARRLFEDYKKSGEMQELQGFLKKYAESHENYVTEFWLDDMYLKNPLPLPINSNPFFLLPKQEFKSDEERFRFIAKFILFSLTFKQRVDSGELKQEFSGGQGKGNALSMATYHRFFTAYRRPGAIKDQHIFSEGSGRHIIVICNNQLFVLVIPGRIALPSEKALVEKLQKIQVLSRLEPHYPPVGILTALNRKEWARIREQMIENENNKESVQIIENCLFVVCMDEWNDGVRKEMRSKSFSDQRLEEMAHHILHGNKSGHSSGNRWFDKFIQFIVTENGVNGIVIEHSVSEGITVLRFCEEFLDFLKKEQPKRSSDDLLTVRRLIWVLNETVEKEIKNASAVTDALIDTLELNIFIFDNYGKGFPKKQKISPDVFIQLCLQLTYYRMHGKVTATYESAALRKFRFGRIDNIRASSQEALDFSKSMLDPSLSQAEKWVKFQKAVKKQTEILLYTINGEGPDNHLLCLKEMAALHGLEEPALYKTDYYKEFLNFRLSTSQLPTTYDIVVGYGPVVPDGYGCSYNPQESRIVFCISSFKNDPSTDSEKFAQNLQVSLMELKELCESVKTAVSTSSPTKAAVKAEAK
ncbi:uncharacterized protein [Centruroides vittatus]|uniref:uncharacterized protein n=1 Tax=Centruroides vittatus TaxID=120091 RepID=UPI0035107A15